MDFDDLSNAYLGPVAGTYVRRRTGGKWNAENAALGRLLTYVPRGSRSLDAPVGTGRSISFCCERDFDAHGVDISPDMLAEAAATARQLGASISLTQADIRALPFPDNHFDVAICVRFLNWIDQGGLRQVLAELARVSRDKLLVGIRYLPPAANAGAGVTGVFRRLMLLAGIARWRASRKGLVNHPHQQVEEAFAELGLKIYVQLTVERRWDGTDYAFFLLLKEPVGTVPQEPPPMRSAFRGSSMVGAVGIEPTTPPV
ncbi:class I SAM-dependent methyltransferase [Sphingomonas arvum]|uniref:class I SAM-dependent methyltransferase n=1 Tax=Sphingomonas arvum TaxID=2992113 RepID=UPI0038B29C97